MQEIIFKTTVDTGSTVKDLQEVEKELSNISESTDKVSGDINSRFQALNEKISAGGLTMREYSKAIREYQAIAVEAGRESPISQEALKNAGELKDMLGDLQTEVSNLGADGSNMKAALELGSTITAGYGALQGAIALTGVESENLEKTMVKLQAVTAVLNGLEQIRMALEKESMLMIKARTIATGAMTVAQTVYTAVVGTTTGAMKALRIAMLAVPIFAILAGVAALVGAIASLFGETEDVTAANDALTESIERQTEAMDRQNARMMRAADNRIKLAKSVNASAEEIHKLELERLKAEDLARERSKLQAEFNIEDKVQLYKKALKQEDSELAKKIKGEVHAERKKYKDLRDLDDQYRIDKQILENNFANEQAKKQEQEDKKADDARKKANDAYKKRKEEQRKIAEEEAQKRLELERTIEDLSLAYMVEGEEKKRIALQIQQKRERDELIKKFGEDKKLLEELKIKQLNEMNDLETQILQEQQTKQDEEAKILAEKELLNERSLLEGKLIQMSDDFEAEQELRAQLALLERDEALKNKELTEGEKFKIEQEYQQKLADLDAQRIAQEQATNEAISKSKQEFASAVASVFGQMAGLAREGSKAQKAFALAEIGINTAVGFVQGLRIAQAAALKSPTPALTFGIFYAQQLASVLGAAKQAKQILGSSTSVQAPTSQTGGGGNSQPTSQAGQGNELTGTESNLTANLQGGGANRVYVVDSDITDVQNKSQKVNAVSTIG